MCHHYLGFIAFYNRTLYDSTLHDNVRKRPFSLMLTFKLSNSYTMGCPPVRGDNPRALASGLSWVQVDKHGITI